MKRENQEGEQSVVKREDYNQEAKQDVASWNSETTRLGRPPRAEKRSRVKLVA